MPSPPRFTSILGACIGAASAALCSGLAAQPGHAIGVLLDFENIGNLIEIRDFYNGGAASNGNIGPNYQVTYSSNSLAIVDQDAGGSGNFANEPSPDSVMFWLSDVDAHMNYAPGFTQFEVYYTSTSFPGTLSFWTGVNGTGTQVGTTINLAPLGSSCGGDPAGAYNCWQKVPVVLPGQAFSVTFGGSADFIAFDNLSFNPQDLPPTSQVPAPLPILGAGAAFGSVKKLKHLSARLKSFALH